MLSTITILFAMSIIMVVQSQTWTGTYTADSTCSRSACCCLDGTIVVTHPSTSILSITSGLSGVCSSLTTFTGTTSYPSGYSGYLIVYGTNVTLTLSSDSKTITAVNPTSSACNGNAVKSGAIKQLANSMTTLAIIFIALTAAVSSNK